MRYVCATCTVPILSSYVLYGLIGSCPLHNPFLVQYSYGIFAEEFRFIYCFVH